MNMSYCRYENTVSDFQDCVDALEEAIQEVDVTLSDTETAARKRMIVLAARYILAVHDAKLPEVVDDEDELADAVEEVAGVIEQCSLNASW